MILHLSDPHFGTEDSTKVHALQQLCWQLKPELVVVSGDLTQRARRSQFIKAKAFLDSLKTPYLVIPGNHDIPLFHLPQRFWQPLDRFKACFGTLTPVCETSHFVVIGLNTIKSHHHTKGSMSLKQIDWVSEQLKQASPHKFKIVVTHQPFFVGQQDESAKKDIPRLMLPALKQWAAYGINALLHGHLHQSAVYDLNQHYFLQQSHQILDIQAGTALSHRLRHGLPNSVNMIHNDLTVWRYDFQYESQQFVRYQQLQPG